MKRKLARPKTSPAATVAPPKASARIEKPASADTIVCRCESVTRAGIEAARTSDINVVKGFTRAGMGLCQGRNCQRLVGTLIGTSEPATARLPARPVALGVIAREPDHDLGRFQ